MTTTASQRTTAPVVTIRGVNTSYSGPATTYRYRQALSSSVTGVIGPAPPGRCRHSITLPRKGSYPSNARIVITALWGAPMSRVPNMYPQLDQLVTRKPATLATTPVPGFQIILRIPLPRGLRLAAATLVIVAPMTHAARGPVIRTIRPRRRHATPAIQVIRPSRSFTPPLAWAAALAATVAVMRRPCRPRRIRPRARSRATTVISLSQRAGPLRILLQVVLAPPATTDLDQRLILRAVTFRSPVLRGAPAKRVIPAPLAGAAPGDMAPALSPANVTFATAIRPIKGHPTT